MCSDGGGVSYVSLPTALSPMSCLSAYDKFNSRPRSLVNKLLSG